jgi:hypothetical protein
MGWAHFESPHFVQPLTSVAVVTGTFFVDLETQVAFVEAINVKEMYSGCYVPTECSIL